MIKRIEANKKKGVRGKAANKKKKDEETAAVHHVCCKVLASVAERDQRHTQRARERAAGRRGEAKRTTDGGYGQRDDPVGFF